MPTAAAPAVPPPAPPAAPVPAAVVHLDEVVDVRTIQLVDIFADGDVSLLFIFLEVSLNLPNHLAQLLWTSLLVRDLAVTSTLTSVRNAACPCLTFMSVLNLDTLLICLAYEKLHGIIIRLDHSFVNELPPYGEMCTCLSKLIVDGASTTTPCMWQSTLTPLPTSNREGRRDVTVSRNLCLAVCGSVAAARTQQRHHHRRDPCRSC